jgi:hypothetical protein
MFNPKEWRAVVLGVDLNRMDRHSSKKRNNPMKKLTKAAIVFGFTLAVASSTSFAQFALTIDEFGGSLNGIPFTIGPDPSGGVTTSPVLIYSLPFAVTPGDVILTEPGQPNGPNSDIVRFWNPTGINQSEIIFYSDFSAADPADAPADVGLPTLLQPIVVRIAETGPEGNNGAVYLAAPGMPGSTSFLPIQYNIISDVPEPGTGALLLSGVGLLFGIKRFRRKGLSLDSRLKS